MYKNYKKLKLILIASSLTFMSYVNAVELLLTHNPLYLNQSVPPALAVTFDDSGSMAWGFMPDGRAWGNISATSPDYNAIAFNPALDYRPPARSDGSLFPNSNYNAAQFDGFYQGGNAATVLGGFTNLNNNYRMVWTSYPNYATGGVLQAVGFVGGGRPPTGEAYYYVWNGAGPATQFGAYNIITMNGATAAARQNFANWYTYYNTRGKLAKAAVSHAFVGFGPDFKIDWQQLNGLALNQTGVNMNLFAGTHRDDFYNWLATVPANGGTPLRRSANRAGLLFTRGSPGDVNSPYYDANFGAELSCQQNFHIAISDGTWNGAAGVATDADSIGIVLPTLDPADVGLTYTYTPTALPESMYSDNVAATLADNGFQFWANDLRTDLDNQVPQYIEDYTDRNGNTLVVPSNQKWWELPELFWNPLNDPASWQHVVNFNIGLGVSGTLDPSTSLAGIRDGTLNWAGANAIDDVWHYSLNSRGKFLSARDPSELASALNNVVSNIVARKGRASSGTVSSSVISSASLSFKTGFDTADWSGSVTASVINSDGSIGAINWDAGCKLTGGVCDATGTTVSATSSPSSRDIIINSSGSSEDFELSHLPSSALIDFSATNYLTSNPSITASDVVDYIRGDRSQEIQNGGLLRNRKTILGDVIHSKAVIIRGPSGEYDDDSWQASAPEHIAALANNGYDDFREANKTRNSILLVGANDGMLHAFDAGLKTASDGGDELWAFMPSSSFRYLAELVDPAYQHKTFVDAAPYVRDAFIDGDWSTVVLGGVRHGGKLFYALDLGDEPEDEPDVLWEFSDLNDIDMGFTYSEGLITRVYDPVSNQSKWVAFLPNGYNSQNHKAAMYAVDLETGAVLHKWLTTTGNTADPNGMGPPIDADFVKYNSASLSSAQYASDQATDFVYAGDLHGNIYKFDALDVFSGTGTTVPTKIFNGTSDQPITTAPRVFTPEDGTQDVVITFGTGKYIETPDRDVTTTPEQYLIGIRDSLNGYPAFSKSDSRLTVQGVALQSANFRELSNNLASPTSLGWIIELPVQGERMVNELARNNRNKTLFMISIIPRGLDPCLPGGQSWLMAIDAIKGTGVTVKKFGPARNKDGVFINDLALGVSLVTTPGGTKKFFQVDITGNGGGSQIIESAATTVWGRKSWHRLILE